MSNKNLDLRIEFLRKQISTLAKRQILFLTSHLAREEELRHMENCPLCLDAELMFTCTKGIELNKAAVKAFEAVQDALNIHRAGPKSELATQQSARVVALRKQI